MTVQTIAPGIFLHPGNPAALSINYKIILVEELIGHIYGRRQKTARIAPEIQYDAFYLSVKGLHGIVNLPARGQRETAELQIQHTVLHLICRVQTIERNLIPDNTKVQRIRDTFPEDIQLHLCPFLTPQITVYRLNRQPCSGYKTGIHPDNLVSCQQAHLLGRATGHRRLHRKRILYDSELYAYALKLALQRLVHSLGILGGNIGRMRVQLPHRGHKGLLNQLGKIHVLQIKPVNQIKYLTVFLRGSAHINLLRGQCQRGEQHHQRYRQQLYYCLFSIHLNNFSQELQKPRPPCRPQYQETPPWPGGAGHRHPCIWRRNGL